MWIVRRGNIHYVIHDRASSTEHPEVVSLCKVQACAN